MDRDTDERRYAESRVAGAGVGRAMHAVNQCNEKAAQEPLSARVDRRLQNLTENAQDLMRIQAILREHPEFERFIELQGLLGRRGL